VDTLDIASLAEDFNSDYDTGDNCEIQPQPATSAGTHPGADDPEGIPFFLTIAQKAELKRRGYSTEAIRDMTPEEGHRILASGNAQSDTIPDDYLGHAIEACCDDGGRLVYSPAVRELMGRYAKYVYQIPQEHRQEFLDELTKVTGHPLPAFKPMPGAVVDGTTRPDTRFEDAVRAAASLPALKAALDLIREHVRMIQQLAEPFRGKGKIVIACFGEAPDQLDPKTEKPGRRLHSSVIHVDVGDVDRAAAGIARVTTQPRYEHYNVYMPLAVFRPDLPSGRKGDERDVIGCLGLIADFDDPGAARWAERLPMPPNYVLETSAGRFQAFYLFDKPEPVDAVKPVAERLKAFARCDHGTSDISHVWRVAGTLNWPNAKKVAEGRPREPQPVRVAQAWDGRTTRLQDLAAVSPAAATASDDAEKDQKHNPQNAAPSKRRRRNGQPHPAAVEGTLEREGVLAELAFLPPQLQEEIKQPAEGDRSKALFRVIAKLIECGRSDDTIENLIYAHPGGIGEKYADRDDLDKEIARIRAKTENDDPITSPAGNSDRTFGPTVVAGGSTKPQTVHIIHGAGGPATAVDWLWEGWLARRKFHIFGGEKGAGKSTLTYHLLATISAGGMWPDGTKAPQGDVLIWSAEDDWSDTILPRLMMAGADMDHVYHVGCVEREEGKRQFDPAIDMLGLLMAAREIPNLTAVMIDPVVLAVTGDSHKNAETRRGLQPLVDLAVACNAALIGITHFTKNTQGRAPIERITGSLAFGALPRVVWGAVKGDDEDAPRRFVRIASNIGPAGGGIDYRLDQAPLPGYTFTAQRVVWGAYHMGSARTLIEEVQGEAKQSKLDRAIAFLCDILAKGEILVPELKTAAAANGISWATLQRAKEKIPNLVARQRPGCTPPQWIWVMLEPAEVDDTALTAPDDLDWSCVAAASVQPKNAPGHRGPQVAV
jgi:hypothetical protein